MSDKNDETNLVRLMMARKFYEDYSEYKGWEPWAFPYVTKGALLQADLAVKFLGFDDELVDELRQERKERVEYEAKKKRESEAGSHTD
jgi:hypothetical protein